MDVLSGLFVLLSIMTFCGSAVYCFRIALDRLHPVKKDVTDDIIKRVEKLEQRDEIKRLRG